MRALLAIVIGALLFTACGGQTSSGSSASVPKSAIEKSADTKIADAGADTSK
ncbi:MAG: hypothetical protein ABI488_23110 [Polyangiaceae bacterium]